MKFKFECPNCGQRISATLADVNTIGVCPGCQRDVNVPASPPSEELAAPPIPQAAPAPTPAAAMAPPPPLPVETPAPIPTERPPVFPPKPPAAPLRPATRAVPPAPAPRPVPVQMQYAAEAPWPDETSQPGLPVFAFLLCAIPIPALIVLRMAGLGNVARFGMLLAGAAGVCVLGIILAHRAWWRSKGRFGARALAFIGLSLGYLSAIILGTMAVALDSGAPVIAKQTEEVPDFKPEGGSGDLTKAEPAAPLIAKNDPAATPSTPPVTPPEPAAMTPAKTEPSTTAAVAGDSPEQFFEAKIRPILADKCYKCHSQESGKSKGGLALDSREALLKGGDTEPAVKPGDPKGSILIKAVLYDDDNLQMPPKGEKLSDQEIADLTAWVKMGAPFPPKAK